MHVCDASVVVGIADAFWFGAAGPKSAASSPGCSCPSPTRTPCCNRLPAEKPEHILLYSAAANELAATDGGVSGPLSPPPRPATVSVLVEKLSAATGRVDRLSSPVLRPTSANNQGAAHKNGFSLGPSGGSGSSMDAEAKRWWQQGGSGGVMQVHAVSAPPAGLELPPLGGSATPLGMSPRALERMEAVRSPTQQLLSRENSGGLSGVGSGGVQLRTAFDRALAEARGSASGGQVDILLDSLNASPLKGPQQRRQTDLTPS